MTSPTTTTHVHDAHDAHDEHDAHDAHDAHDVKGRDATVALGLRELVVKASTFGDEPKTPLVTRDLPDLARFLFHALGADVEEDVSALDRVSLSIAPGESVALIGEAGGGKSTLARTCARRLRPTSGSVELFGVDVHRARGKKKLDVRRNLQVLFDDDEAMLDPRLTLRESFALVDRALRLQPSRADDREQRMRSALERARVRLELLDVRAADMHAGDRKRAALARALLADPAVLVVDEPAGGLDPSERAFLLETFVTLRGRMSFLFLCADLAAARTLAERVGVLEKGALVEIARADEVFEHPRHPYAQALVAAAPRVRR